MIPVIMADGYGYKHNLRGIDFNGRYFSRVDKSYLVIPYMIGC